MTDLAFGHPGLATTAGRVGAKLTLQNDIGETDAHVQVAHVDRLSVTVTYTDVHRARAKFFISLFDSEAVSWSPLAENQHSDLAKGEVFFLLTGAYAARDEKDLDRFLSFLGSRIVFLIDWNKARKALRTFVGKSGARPALLPANAIREEDAPRPLKVAGLLAGEADASACDAGRSGNAAGERRRRLRKAHRACDAG